jgi:hypothetical protein
VETTNYRTIKLPSDAEVPLFVRDDFARFYRDLFARAVRREEMRTLFTNMRGTLVGATPARRNP